MRSLFTAILLATALATAPTGSPTRAATPPPDAVTEPEPAETERGNSVVKRIQKGLAESGFYLGPLDGIMGRETEAAIRAYQKHHGMRIDPTASEALAQQIEMGPKVQMLLQRLDKVRRKNIEAARKALLGQEATRHLLEKPADEVADPTRNPAPCFRTPDPACLLAEAAETAKTITRPDMRDWARGELLVSQARAGLTTEAMDTARRISDPRLILVALRDLAEAEAKAGRGAEALAAVAVIPDDHKRAEALIAIAELQAEHGLEAAARTTAERLLVALGSLRDRTRRVAFQSRAAVVLSRAGAPDKAQGTLSDAEFQARRLTRAEERGLALRHVASARADLEESARAVALLDEIPEASDHTPVLISTAGLHARDGDFGRALELAGRIEEERYRTVALCRIAMRQADAGLDAAARETLEKARRAAKEVRLPYARDFATSHMALTLSKLGRVRFPDDAGAGRETFIDAEDTARAVNDDRLRSHTLWTIAAERRRAGDAEGAEQTARRARDAAFDIKSALTRVWMYADIALERAEADEPEEAETAFRRGLDEAEGIANAWARARALAKLGAALADLATRGVGGAPGKE